MDDKWIVDAMNVIGSRPDRWWIDPDEAMRAFAQAVDAHAAARGKDITVVFDKDPSRLPKTPHIQIVIAARRGHNAADYEIERLVKTAEDPASVRVVTSDRRLIEKVTSFGSKVVWSGRFRAELDR